jgi:hypothetical protein
MLVHRYFLYMIYWHTGFPSAHAILLARYSFFYFKNLHARSFCIFDKISLRHRKVRALSLQRDALSSFKPQPQPFHPNLMPSSRHLFKPYFFKPGVTEEEF